MEEVNEFLKDLDNNELIDIKYSKVVRGDEIFYSALMIYEEKENQGEDNLTMYEWWIEKIFDCGDGFILYVILYYRNK